MECNKNVPKPCTLRFLQCWTVTVFPVWGFLDACAFTALFEADVLMHFVDSFVHVVTGASFPDRHGLCL